MLDRTLLLVVTSSFWVNLRRSGFDRCDVSWKHRWRWKLSIHMVSVKSSQKVDVEGIFQEFSRSLVESYVKVRINLMDINSIIGSQNLFIFSSVIIILLFSLYSFLLYFLQIVIFLFKRIYIYSMQMYFL